MPTLADVLYNTPVGHVINLHIAEYEGPVLIDQSVHIIGMGRGSVLWNRVSPVLVITSPGVVLENVLFDVTGEPDGTPIWYAPGCQPKLINCYPYTVEMKQMAKNIIHLGTINVEQTIELPLIIEKTSRWNGLDGSAMPNSLSIAPLLLNRHMHRGFIITLHVPKEEGYFYKILNCETDNGNDQLHIFGRIAPKAAVHHQKPLCLNIQGKRLHFGEGLELTDEHLGYVTNATLAKGVYGWFIKELVENEVVWVFWLPTEAPQTVRVNGVEISRWTRVVLTVGMELQFGGVLGRIEEVDNILLNMPATVSVTVTHVSGVDFTVPITINAKFFQNLLGGKQWSGAVTSLVAWLDDVPSEPVTIGKDFTLRLRVNQGIITYPNGVLWARNVLLLHNQTDIFSISLQLNLAIPQYALDIDPPIVDMLLPDFESLHQGEVAGASGRVKLTNTGRACMTLTLDPKPEVIIPDKAKEITLDSQQTVVFPLKLSQHANRLPQGLYQEPQAVIINGVLQTAIGVRAQIEQANVPILHLEDVSPFPEYNIAYPSRVPITASFNLVNRGAIIAKYHIVVSKGDQAVKLSQYRGELAVGETQRITMTIPPNVLRMIEHPTKETIELQILGNRPDAPEQPLASLQKISFNVDFIDKRPIMSLNPTILDLPDSIEGQPYNVNKVVDLLNTGNLPFQATLTNNVPWLTVVGDTAFSVNSNDVQQIRIETNDKIKDLSHGQYHINNAIVITGEPPVPNPLQIGVRIFIQKAEPRPHIVVPVLNFGILERGVYLAKDTLIIGNYGQAPWRATIHCHLGYVSAPMEVEIAPNMVAEIEVCLDTRALEYGAYYWENLITISAPYETKPDHQFSIDGYVVIEKPHAKLIFEPEKLKLANVLLGMPVITKHLVTLHNFGTLTWQNDPALTKKTDWLSVHPTEMQVDMGASQELEIYLNDTVASLPAGIYTDEFVLSDGNTNVRLPVQLEVCQPNIRIEPTELNIRASTLPHRNMPEKNVLTIINDSQADFLLSIINRHDGSGNLIIPNIFKYSPPDRQVVIRANERYEIYISQNDSELNGQFEIVFRLPNQLEENIRVIVD